MEDAVAVGGKGLPVVVRSGIGNTAQRLPAQGGERGEAAGLELVQLVLHGQQSLIGCMGHGLSSWFAVAAQKKHYSRAVPPGQPIAYPAPRGGYPTLFRQNSQCSFFAK